MFKNLNPLFIKKPLNTKNKITPNLPITCINGF